MSNPKTAIAEIKKLMVQFGFMQEQTPLSFKLADNTILQTEKLESGNSIFKINDAFEKVSLEDGTYKLVENFEIQVKDGKIETVKELFLDAKLVDGTAIKVEGDGLVEGAKVVVVTADAEIPAPDGVHELEDGTKVETKDGLIAKVVEAVAEEPEAPEGPEIEVELPASIGMEKEVVEMVKEFVSKMGEKISKMEQDYAKLQNEFNSFKKEPAAKKIADGKTESFSKITNDDMFDAKLQTVLSFMKSNNK